MTTTYARRRIAEETRRQTRALGSHPTSELNHAIAQHTAMVQLFRSSQTCGGCRRLFNDFVAWADLYTRDLGELPERQRDRCRRGPFAVSLATP